MDQQEECQTPHGADSRPKTFHPYQRHNNFQQNRGMNRFGPFSPQNQNSPRGQNHRNGHGGGGGGGGYNRNCQNYRNNNQRNFPRRKFTPNKNHSADVPIEGYFHPSMVEDPWGGPKAAVEENAESSSDEVPLEDDPADE